MSSDENEVLVSTNDRPVLVLAGPGSGKTYLLGDKVKHLLDAGINNNNITVLTFGRDASQNMRNKLLNTKDGFSIAHNMLPHISTLNALGLEIVNRDSHTVNLNKTDLKIQESREVKNLLYRDAAFILGHSEVIAKSARSCKEIGLCNKGSRDPECSICEKYWEIMSKCNCIDFDDQVLFACRILETNPELLAEYRNRCLHLLVDEYQDINAAQFKLIDLLSANSREGLLAVGDDAQSIYSFRGGSPEFILNFAKYFPNAITPPLAHSRRCHEEIMTEAEIVLKKYYTDWTGPHKLKYHVTAGKKPLIWHVPSEEYEAEIVARIAREAIGEKKTVLILVPKKEFFFYIHTALRQYQVLHEYPTNLLPDTINERFKVLFSLLNWVKNPQDNFLTRLAIESLINHGINKIPGMNKNGRCRPDTIKRREIVEIEIAKLWETVSRRKNLMTNLAEHSASSPTLLKIHDTLGDLISVYIEFDGDSRGEFVKRLTQAGGVWVNPENMVTDLSAIGNILSAGQISGFGSVQLMTMKKAKGLEADVVVMVGLEDDLIPNPGSNLAEEARLFYVSMTRAKEKLYLIHSFKRPRNISHGEDLTHKKRSRFIDALGRESEFLRKKAKTS